MIENSAGVFQQLPPSQRLKYFFITMQRNNISKLLLTRINQCFPVDTVMQPLVQEGALDLDLEGAECNGSPSHGSITKCRLQQVLHSCTPQFIHMQSREGYQRGSFQMVIYGPKRAPQRCLLGYVRAKGGFSPIPFKRISSTQTCLCIKCQVRRHCSTRSPH